MKNVNAQQMTQKRINTLGLYLAEFALEFIPADHHVNSYNANDFLMLFDDWYESFIRYAETNRMFLGGEKEALIENTDDLIFQVKEAAIDAAREIIMAKV